MGYLSSGSFSSYERVVSRETSNPSRLSSACSRMSGDA